MILLGLVLSWSINSLITAPQPSTDNTPTPEVIMDESATPAPDSGGYDWRDTKLYLATLLPESPTEANVYILKPDQHATVEEASALAQRFGIDGEVYIASYKVPGATDYLITDGKQRLFVQSENYFTYYADYGNSFLVSKKINQNEANVFIEAFLKSHGFNFQYQIEKDFRIAGVYYVVPLTSDGFAVRNDYNLPIRIEIGLDDYGQVFRLQSSLINYDVVGKFGIRSAEEAFNQIFSETQIGIQENFLSGGSLNESNWQRIYPDNQTITIYGHITSYPSIELGKVPFLEIDAHVVTGNISGLEAVDPSTFVEASGQFYIEDRIRKFNIESWKVSDSTPIYIVGTLRREDNRSVLTTDDRSSQYILTDVPADVPLNTKIPDEQLSVAGVLVDGNFQWSSIQYLPPGSNFGGGGGGGTGFYKLNLSGTPVPFPTPQPELSQGSVEYIIKEGDTVLAIAQAHGITPEKIVQANSWLSEEHALTPGKALIIPAAQLNSQSRKYVVTENDTLASIALNVGITVDELMQANGITDNIVFTGQMLIIPRGQVTYSQGITLPEEHLTQLEIGQRLEGERGIFQVNIYQTTQRIWYGFFETSIEKSNLPYMILESTDLQNLHKYNNLPINIWGTIDRLDEVGRPIVTVDRYEIPFPDLKIQVLEGTQKVVEIQGKQVLTFTANNGTTYVQIGASVYPLDHNSLFGNEGDQLIVEALIVPDETFEGYPAVRIYGITYAVDPVSGQADELTITADQFNTYEEPPTPTEVYVPPSATIEKVELVYYIPDPRHTPSDPSAGPKYLQPAWRFYGHYGNGDEFEFLVQALKQEYLLPELVPYTPPG